MRKNCLKDDDYVVVHCSNKWGIAELHAAILKRVGYEVTQSLERRLSTRASLPVHHQFDGCAPTDCPRPVAGLLVSGKDELIGAQLRLIL